MHPIHINNALKLNVIYSIHSGDGIHSFLRKQSVLGTIVDQQVSGCIKRNLTIRPNIEHLM